MAQVPFVHSNYERKENDDYQTIDDRCIRALIETPEMRLPTDNLYHYKYVDICGSHGSGIVRSLKERNFDIEGLPDAFVPIRNTWAIITNPPYDRKIVDRIAAHALQEIKHDEGPRHMYFLMRANWDCAITRSWLFDSPNYSGQLRMRFRPWWSEERKAQPIHNYVWHHWDKYGPLDRDPVVSYWPRLKTQ